MASKIVLAAIAVVVLILIIGIGYFALSKGSPSSVPTTTAPGQPTTSVAGSAGGNASSNAKALVSQANASSTPDYNGSGLSSNPVANSSTAP